MDGHHSAGVEGRTCRRRGPSPGGADGANSPGPDRTPWECLRAIACARGDDRGRGAPARGTAPATRDRRACWPGCPAPLSFIRWSSSGERSGEQGSSCRQDPRSVPAKRNGLRLNALDRWGGRAYRRVGASVGERPVPDQPGEVVEQQRGRKREVRRLAGPSRVGAECVRPRRGTPGRPGLRGAPAAVAAVARSSRPIAWTRTGSADRGVHRAPQWARDRSQIRVRGIVPWLSPVKGHVPTIGCPKLTPIISRCTAAPTPSAVQRRT